MLKKTMLVVALVVMLSFDPAPNLQTLRVERAMVEYVLPGVNRGRRMRTLRGSRRRVVPLPIHFHSIHCYQG